MQVLPNDVSNRGMFARKIVQTAVEHQATGILVGMPLDPYNPRCVRWGRTLLRMPAYKGTQVLEVHWQLRQHRSKMTWPPLGLLTRVTLG